MKNLFFLLLVILALVSCEKETATPSVSEPSQSIEFRSPTDKIDVCHYSEEDNSWHLINISLNAWKAHAAHGDVRLDDQDGDGFVPDNQCNFGQQGDCDDNDASLNPNTKWYLDADEDGYAAGMVTQCLSPGDGYTMTVLPEGDCDDDDPEVNPGAKETPYNGKDDDCNPSTPDDDLDRDGYNEDEDCDDTNAAINPGAEEICNDGLDNDCDGATDTDDDDCVVKCIYPEHLHGTWSGPVDERINFETITLIFDCNSLTIKTFNYTCPPKILQFVSFNDGIYKVIDANTTEGCGFGPPFYLKLMEDGRMQVLFGEYEMYLTK